MLTNPCGPNKLVVIHARPETFCKALEALHMKNDPSDGLIWYVAFLFSLTCHEAAHALVAKWGGDKTAHDAGQVTLNPIPHMRREPLGTIVIPIISFVYYGWMLGWASAPFDPDWQRRHPHRSAWMALAGPVANLIVVLLSALVICIGVSSGSLEFAELISFSHIVVAAPDHSATGFSMLLSILFSLNLLLATFNLMPVPPLDGATVIGLFVNEETALKIYDATRNSTFQLLGLLVVWNMFGEIFRPIFREAFFLLRNVAEFF